MRYHVTLSGRTIEVEIAPEGITVKGRPVRADLQPIPGTDVRSLLLDGASYPLVVRRGDAGHWNLHLGGRPFVAEVVDERTRAIREMTGAVARPSGPHPLRAPMPGMVVKIEVAAGDSVAAGQGLVIMEAMKMENELKAEAGGRVRHVHVEAGQAVEKDQVLVEFEPPEGPEEGTAP
jgi:acetyl/propionyl-CoA carboxylase alpha subunit